MYPFVFFGQEMDDATSIALLRYSSNFTAQQPGMVDAMEKNAEYLAFYKRVMENDATKLHAMRAVYTFSRLVSLQMEKANNFG